MKFRKIIKGVIPETIFFIALIVVWYIAIKYPCNYFVKNYLLPIQGPLFGAGMTIAGLYILNERAKEKRWGKINQLFLNRIYLTTSINIYSLLESSGINLTEHDENKKQVKSLLELLRNICSPSKRKSEYDNFRSWNTQKFRDLSNTCSNLQNEIDKEISRYPHILSPKATLLIVEARDQAYYTSNALRYQANMQDSFKKTGDPKVKDILFQESDFDVFMKLLIKLEKLFGYLFQYQNWD